MYYVMLDQYTPSTPLPWTTAWYAFASTAERDAFATRYHIAADAYGQVPPDGMIRIETPYRRDGLMYMLVPTRRMMTKGTR